MMMIYLSWLISISNHITYFDLLLQVILDTLRSQNEGNTQLVLRGVIPNEVVLYILWNIPTEMKISVSFKNSPQLVYLIIYTYYYYCKRCTKSVDVFENAYILWSPCRVTAFWILRCKSDIFRYEWRWFWWAYCWISIIQQKSIFFFLGRFSDLNLFFIN